MRHVIAVITTGIALLPGRAAATDSSVSFIRAHEVHEMGYRGQDITVAVIDTGIYYDHHGLLGSIAPGGISFEDGRPVFDEGADIYGNGHGTYMSLIITDATGVAPDAAILPIRVFGPDGKAKSRDVALAIEYARQRRERFDRSIRVINLSLGWWGDYGYSCRCDNEHPRLAIEIHNAAAAGIVSFAATGNDACCGGIRAPACVFPAMPVAAAYDGYYGLTDFYFQDPLCTRMCGDWSQPNYVTCFSNWVENCSGLSAPGYDITVWEFSGDGTSQATAHCSGVAALMFQRGGCALTAWEARRIIYNTARDIGFAYPYCRLPPSPRHVDALNAVLAVAPWCPGDINGDGVVNLSDLGILLANWGQSVPPCAGGDLNGDGRVDLADLGILLANFGKVCP